MSSRNQRGTKRGRHTLPDDDLKSCAAPGWQVMGGGGLELTAATAVAIALNEAGIDGRTRAATPEAGRVGEP